MSDLDTFLKLMQEEEDSDSKLEELASIEHDQWMEWAKDILEKEDISEERATRWKALFVPYEELSDEMKELDRKYARKTMDAMKE